MPQKEKYKAEQNDNLTGYDEEWLWDNRIPLGSITSLAGKTATGKTSITLEISSKVTTGGQFPDSTFASQGKVLLISYDDPIERVIIPRLTAAGADISKIRDLKYIKYFDGIEKKFAIDDTEVLRYELAAEPNVKLVVIDPLIMAFVNSSDNKDRYVRSKLQSLKNIAEEYHVAILIVDNFNKQTGRNFLGRINKISSSRAQVDIPSSILGCIEHPYYKRFMLTHEKSYNTPTQPSLVYSIEENKKVPKSRPHQTNCPSCIVWHGETNISSYEAIKASDFPKFKAQLMKKSSTLSSTDN